MTPTNPTPISPEASRLPGPTTTPEARPESALGQPGGSPGGQSAGQPAPIRQARHAGTHGGVRPGQGASRPGNRKGRLLKGSDTLQSPARRASADIRWSVTRNLTERDREVLRLLERFRVLTTPQVAQLLFGSHKRASARLLEMHDVNLLDRFRPYREDWGSHPWHWVVGPLGAGVLAAEKGEHAEKATRRWRGERTLAYACGQRLAHLVGVNDLFVALSAHARHHAGARVVDWMTEAEAAKWTDGLVRPDAFGEWDEDGQRLEVFFEYDRGTESLPRLVAKLADYERFEAERQASAWVLFAFTSARREHNARAALAGATLPVATAALVDGAEPQEAVWLPLDGGSARLRLAALADVPKPPETLDRAERGHRGWLYKKTRERRQ